MIFYNSYLYVGTSTEGVVGGHGGQLWRSALSGGPPFTDWTKVNSNGFGDSDDYEVRALIGYGGYLYAGTRNNVDGGRLFRTAESGGPPYTDWVKVNSNGFGDADNRILYSMSVYNSNLYVGTYNVDSEVGGQLWRTGASGGPPFTDWTQVNLSGFSGNSNAAAMCSAVLGSDLYVGTSGGRGCQVWKYNGTTWTQVNTDGFGTSANNSADSMVVFGSYLYVATNNGGGSQVWRTAGGVSPTWAQVNSSGFGGSYNTAQLEVWGSLLCAGASSPASSCRVFSTDGTGSPLTWTPIGVGDLGGSYNQTICDIVVNGSYLYACTRPLTPGIGCAVWRTNGTGAGATWNQVNAYGFGDTSQSMASAMAVLNGYLYVGTSGTSPTNQGCRVYRSACSGSTPFGDWTQVNANGFGNSQTAPAPGMQVANGFLYVSATNSASGCEVWKTAGQGGPPFTDWTQTNTSGFGDAHNSSARGLTAYDLYLYAGTENTLEGAEVWRTVAAHAAPTVTSITPNSGTTGTTVPITNLAGTSFYGTPTVKLKKSGRTDITATAVNVVSGNQITCTFNLIGAAAGAWDVYLENPDTQNAALPNGFTIDNPAPTITGLSPDHKTVGDAGFTLTVNGTGFIDGSVVRFDGADRATTHVSDTRLTAPVYASDLGEARVFNVTVFNPTPGGGESAPATFTIDNPAPTITGLSPDHKIAGDPGFTLTVNGTGFNASSVVRWGGTDKATSLVSGHLEAPISDADISSAGTVNVTVFNPTPGGGESAPATFTIDNPAPTITSVTPSTGTQGTTVSITDLNGTGFYGTPTVKLKKTGSTDITATSVTVVSPTQITCTFTLPAGTTLGSWNLYVQNPDHQSATKSGAFTVKSPQYTWYLAEGDTSGIFSTYISIANPNTSAVHATLTYMTTTGTVSGGTLTLPAKSQTTVNPASKVGAKQFATKVVCAEGKPICADRTVTWTGPGATGPEGHSSVGVTTPAKTWYLPEGSSAWGFDCKLALMNPNSSTATVTLTYMIEGSGPVTKTKTVAGNRRATFNMASDIGSKDASIKVTSNIPVVPERSMYRNNYREGHCSIGTTAPAADFYLAEGTSAWGFTTYVLVQNPSSSAATVNITFMTGTGPVAYPAFSMPANSRKTIRVNDFLPNKDFSTRVHGSKAIIAERSMYWDSPAGEACHDSVGLSSPHTTFYLPDGQSSQGRETWTLVQNPNTSAVTVEITYMTPTGSGNKVFTDTIPANSRKTYSLADKIPSGRAAIMVKSKTSGKKIMVERAMYWSSRCAGTDTIGGCAD